MKDIARMALTPGMVLADDVINYQSELILSRDKVLSQEDIMKLERHQIMVVSIKEPADLADSTYEKVRLSNEFRKFDEIYHNNLDAFKAHINDFLQNNTPIDTELLLNLHDTVTDFVSSDYNILKMLYFMTPSEDEVTYTHCFNSALIASVFAKWLFLPKEDTRILILCSFLYDIGKTKLPDKIIWKPGKLSDFEFNWMKTHTTIGYKLLKDQPLDQHIINSALMHHEKADGSGYPNHLKNDDIDVYAKYCNIIDAYEAMTSVRSYRSPFTPFQVIASFEKMLNQSLESQFILRPIMEKLASYQLGTTVRLSDGTVGEVIYNNSDHLSKPLIKIDNKVLNMAEHPNLEITGIV